MLNISQLPAVLVQIFEEAFNFKAIFAGFAGSAMMQGIRRGLYSNEAGIGSAPNAGSFRCSQSSGEAGIGTDAVSLY